uniref:Uncharacterized protein n=1 Tax=Ananas comosus var. bracteatus TaxID=296719 RepID=A0A6V7NSX7_ANACO|nr:unnamed protein product [Ananas comosus var. bracteatus]
MDSLVMCFDLVDRGLALYALVSGFGLGTGFSRVSSVQFSDRQRLRSADQYSRHQIGYIWTYRLVDAYNYSSSVLLAFIGLRYPLGGETCLHVLTFPTIFQVLQAMRFGRDVRFVFMDLRIVVFYPSR